MIACLKNVANAGGSYCFSAYLFDSHVEAGTWEAGLIFRFALVAMIIADVFYIHAIIKHKDPEKCRRLGT